MEIVNTPLPKEKKQIGRIPKYSIEYYMMMAKQIEDDGLTHRDAAKIYGCSHGTVSHWLKLYRNGVLPNRVKKAKRDEVTKESTVYRLQHVIQDLKTEVGELYLENVMLKKALAYSQRLKKQNLSVITSESLDQLPGDAG